MAERAQTRGRAARRPSSSPSVHLLPTYNTRMRTTLKIIPAAAVVGGLIVAAQAALGMASSGSVGAQEAQVPDAAKLEQMAARFAPTDIGADLSRLSPADRRVVAKLVE